jgi:hypothetical protein
MGTSLLGSQAVTSLACYMGLYVVATKGNKMHMYREWAKMTYVSDVTHGPLASRIAGLEKLKFTWKIVDIVPV